MAAGDPTKAEREDASLLAHMVLAALARGVAPPIVTDDRLWLICATMRYIIKNSGTRVLD